MTRRHGLLLVSQPSVQLDNCSWYRESSATKWLRPPVEIWKCDGAASIRAKGSDGLRRGSRPHGACQLCAACNLRFICSIRAVRANMGPGMQRERLAAAAMTSTDKGDDFIRAHGRESREGVFNRKRGVMEMLWALLIGMNSQSQVTAAKTLLPYFDGHFAEYNFIFNSESPCFNFCIAERLHLQSVTSGVTAFGIMMELNHGNCHHPFIKH